jgi:DNA replication protein DnaC
VRLVRALGIAEQNDPSVARRNLLHVRYGLLEHAIIGRDSVYFTTLADLVRVLAKAEREGSLREKIRFLCRFALLIVDEIGYLPVTPGGGNL